MKLLEIFLNEIAEQITALEAEDKILNSNGSMFTVTFIKQDGSERVMNCRLGVTKHLRGGTLAYDHKSKGFISVWDLQNKGYRMINKNTITALKINGKDYIIT